MWPKPEIIDVVAGKIRIVNITEEPKQLKKNEQFCQILPTILASKTSPMIYQNLRFVTTNKNITREQLQTLSFRFC